MNPAWLDDMSWEMAEVYGAITDQIMVNLAKYFPYYKPGASVPKSAFTYQAAMLAQMGQVNKETIAIIRAGLKDADSALAGVLEQAIIDSVSKAEKPLLQAVKKGIFAPPQTPVVAPNQMRAFRLYYQQASDKLNLVNTVMLESTASAYRQAVNDVALQVQINERIQATQTALDVGAGETITGVSSWNQAVQHSIARMKENGITGFIDHAGRHWSAEAYTAMDIRTTVMNTARAAVWETNETFGNDLYLVSYHNGARPLCYDWQNKVISSTNMARDTVDLDGNPIHVYAQSETTYGEAAGLFGINCKHYPTPFIPGVSVINGTPQSPEENERTYAESQQQRGLERKLREEKRDIMMAKAQGAPQEVIDKLTDKARQTSSDIDDFCDQTGRARHRDREAVYTRRAFPSKETYDVQAFERTQKEQMQQFFTSGGAQRQYTAGVMQPNVPLVPNAQPTGDIVQTTSGGMRSSSDIKPKPERPKRENYDTEEEYIAARDKYRVEKAEWEEQKEKLIDDWMSMERTIKTHDDFEAWAQSRGVRVDESVRKVDPAVLDEVAKTQDELFERFPEVKAYIDSMYPYGHSFEDTLDYLMEGSSGVNFGGAFKDARRAYREVIEQQIDGTFVRGDGTLKTVVRHEYGHNVDHYIRSKFRTIDSPKEWETSGKLMRRHKARMQYEKELLDMAQKHGSAYSKTNVQEAFAEGFAEYTSNPDSAFGRAFGEFLQRWYYADPIE